MPSTVATPPAQASVRAVNTRAASAPQSMGLRGGGGGGDGRLGGAGCISAGPKGAGPQTGVSSALVGPVSAHSSRVAWGSATVGPRELDDGPLELLDPPRQALDVDAQCLIFHGLPRPPR